MTKPKTKGMPTLYCGTTERVAKLAPVAGINPDGGRVYLSDIYPGLLAFYASTDANDRFGILEVDHTMLDPEHFLPSEWFLEQTSRPRAKGAREQSRKQESFRKNLEKYHTKWKESLQKLGVVVYDAFIPKKAIRRITIYDPASNSLITDEIVGSRITVADYKNEHSRYLALTRWLAGESIAVEDWMGESVLEATKEEKEQLAERLQNKSGLDVFYYEPPPKGT